MLRPHNRAELTFDYLERIGQEGANSQVYRSRDHQLGAELAIKQISKRELGDPAVYFREANILYLSSHPNVVPIHYACEDTNNVYLAMPYYSNGSLASLLSQQHLSVREIVRLATQFLSGLQNIHTKGLIHFDVKPANILLSQRMEALLSDFGLAKHATHNGEAGQDRVYGKIAPPESFGRDGGFTIAFDIYQAGITLYRMCAGEQNFQRQLETYGPIDAFDRETFRFDVRNGRFPDRTVYPLHIPERLRRVIRKCLETDPTNRPGGAVQVINELADIDGPLLDWQYAEDDTGSRTWSKNLDSRTIRLVLDADSQATATTTSDRGAVRRVPEYCRQLDSRAVRTFLEAY